MTGTILEKIISTKRREVAEARSRLPLDELRRKATSAPLPRDFYSAVVGSSEEIRLIAEIKKSSPSAGLIRADFDPASIARRLEEAGADALSVLTDHTYFEGDLAFIQMVKDVVGLPVLRKDFIVDEYQVYESRAAGADAILLIAAVLSAKQVDLWSRLAGELGMTSLIEIHDRKQWEAVKTFVRPERHALLGINNRDLRHQRTDLRITHDLAALITPGTAFVSESGVKRRADVLSIQRAGAAAMLVGESLMRTEDPGRMVRELLGR